MKIAMNLLRLTLVLSVTSMIVLAFSPLAKALDNYKEFKRDHWDFDLGGQYFYSQANYINTNSGSQNLPSDNHFKLIDGTFTSRYMTREMSIFAAGTFSSAESKDSLATRTNSSITHLIIGLDFNAVDGFIQVIPEVGILIPLVPLNTTADKVLNSEGAYESWFRFVAQKNLTRSKAYSWLGFDYRSEGRSYLVPWGLGFQTSLGKIKLGGEVFGTQSATQDKDTGTFGVASRQAVVNSIDAGSYKFYFPNPSVVDSQLYLIWNLNPRFSIQLNGGSTLTGENTAAGYHVGGFLRYSFDMGKGSSPQNEFIPQQQPVDRDLPIDKPLPKSRPVESELELSSEKKVIKFKEETQDGVDQKLFRPKPTKKPKTVEDDLQDQMDKTEFQIELKQKRGK